MRSSLLAGLLALGCPRVSTTSSSAVAPLQSEPEAEPQPAPPPPRGNLRIAEPEPGGLEAKCRPERRRACLQAKAYPDELLQWELELKPRCDGIDCPPGSTEPELLTVLAELLAHGAHDLHVRGRSEVRVLLSHDDVLAAARLDEVIAIGVECGDSAFCSCADMPPDRCEEHAFCHTIAGREITERCVSPRDQPIGCSAETACDASVTDVYAPDGSMWRLRNSCRPSAPGWRTHPSGMIDRPPCSVEPPIVVGAVRAVRAARRRAAQTSTQPSRVVEIGNEVEPTRERAAISRGCRRSVAAVCPRPSACDDGGASSRWSAAASAAWLRTSRRQPG